MRLRIIGCIAATSLLAGCGGADGPVPDVRGDRLDVAKSTMSDAGYDTEELGGGVFGIVDESNWTVCETDPPAGSTGSGTVKLVVDRSCGSAASAEDSAAAAEEAPVAEAEEQFEEEQQPEAPARRVRVPNVVGMNHQAAQNRMQAAGLYMLDEEDATGAGRMLLYDRNWVVVSQSPRPGARVREDRPVLLRAKKLGE